MKFKEWLKYKRTLTRKELLIICLVSSVGFIFSLIALLIIIVIKPHNKDDTNKSLWRK